MGIEGLSSIQPIDMPNLNLSGSLNVLKLFANPALCLPHHTVSSFDKIPVPLSSAFNTAKGDKKPDIRAVVLDKDNCFAIPHQNEIYPSYKAKFDEIRQAYPGSRLLIVSNSSGTGADPGFKDAELLERNTGVTVLRHSTKKPGCHGEIMEYFRSKPDCQVMKPEQVAIVGDRLFTDMMMANMMGAHSVWVRDGVIEDRNIVSKESTRDNCHAPHPADRPARLHITAIRKHVLTKPSSSPPSSLASRNTSPASSKHGATRLPTLTAISSRPLHACPALLTDPADTEYHRDHAIVETGGPPFPRGRPKNKTAEHSADSDDAPPPPSLLSPMKTE